MHAYRTSSHIYLFHGSQCQRRRESLGKSLEDVAAACGVSKQAVHNWEQGRASPRNEGIFDKLIIELGGLDQCLATGVVQGFEKPKRGKISSNLKTQPA